MAEQKQKTAYERLKEYETEGAHMLIPSAISIADIAQGFALIVEPVFLKPHPRDKDVYPHDGTQYDYKATPNDWKPECRTGGEMVRIHKQGFDRLAQAARVDWMPAQIVHDPKFPGRMMASVEGMIRTSTGELYRIQDIAGMDLDIEMEKIRAAYSYNGKFDDKKQWLVDRDFLQKKANQQKFCISGAKNRVIKQLLCLRNTYTVAEIGKPFVAVRIVPKLDTSDPYTRKRLVDMQIAAMAGVYGLIPSAQPQAQIEMSGPVPDEAFRDDDPNVIEGETTTGNGAAYPLDKSQTMAPASDLPPFAMDDPPAPDPVASLRADFLNSDVEGQCKTLTILSGQKAYSIGRWLKQIGANATLQSLKPEQRVQVYDFLMTKPDAEKGGKVA